MFGIDDIALGIVGSSIIGGVSGWLGGREQAKGAERAGEAQERAARESADVQREMYYQTREDLAPYRDVGGKALYSLADLMGIQPNVPATTAQPAPTQTPMLSASLARAEDLGQTTAQPVEANALMPRSDRFGELAQPFNAEDWRDPGYDFRLAEGQKALERSAAARGNLFSGATGKALQRYGQDYASGEYQNAFNRYQTSGNTLYNRLAGLSGTGQTATTNLGQFGSQTAGNVGNALMAGGRGEAQGYLGASQARASGYQGVGNAAQSGISNFLFYDMMKKPTAYGVV